MRLLFGLKILSIHSVITDTTVYVYCILLINMMEHILYELRTQHAYLQRFVQFF